MTHFQEMLLDHEKATAHILRRQITDPALDACGAFVEESRAIDTRWCGMHLSHLVTAWTVPGNRYYHDPEVAQAVVKGAGYLLRHQRPGGCLDLTSCNFDSAPDTAFAVNELISGWYLLEKDDAPDAEALRKPLLRLIESCSEGVMNGGFHTPNHRWAISACLKHAAAICSRPDFSARADAYLGEGLDIDREGEFAERSGGIYNKVNDDQMIRLYLATGDRAYLEAARSNLRMMLRYIDPDGSVFTHNSTRQDNGQKVYLDGYYGLFLLTGYLLGDEELAAFSEYCWQTAAAHGCTPRCLPWLALYPDLEAYGKRRPWNENEILRTHHLYPASRIGRHRQGDWSCTVMAGRPNFLYFQHGENAVYLVMYQNVCAERNFVPETVTETENGFRLTARTESWYYLPYGGNGPATSDWWAMDNANTREKQIRDALTTSVEVSFLADGADVRIRSERLSGVPVRLEWGFLPGCRLRNEHFTLETVPGGCMTVGGGSLQAEKGENGTVSLGPAFARHDVRNRMGGAYPLSGQHFTVFFSDFSPFERVVRLRACPAFGLRGNEQDASGN